MITVDELNKMWEKDAVVDQLDLGNEAANVQRLHSKYLTLLSPIRLQLRTAEVQYYKMINLRKSYYMGELSKEELTALGWEQYRKNKPLKNQLEELLQADDLVIRRGDRVELLKTLQNAIESILKSIHSRTWDIKNAITWKTFIGGG